MMFRMTPVSVLAVLLAAAAQDASSNWPSFRGPAACGVAEGHPTPAMWDVEERRNVRWKTPIPGLGHSAPVVWGDRLFVTTAVSGMEQPELKVGLYGDVKPVEDATVHRWKLFCLDRKSGAVLWERTAHEGVPRVKRHPKSTHANSTPATDGKRLVAIFGSEGLFCYDMDGTLAWKKDLGPLDSGWHVSPAAQWGFASSPVIDGNRVIVQGDVQKDSFLAAFDLADGRELWRARRDEVPTWGTPTVHRSAGRAQVIVNGWRHIGGYDLETGRELWRMKGGGDIPVPTPVVAHGLVFIANAHGGAAPLYAVRVDASGDLSLKGDETSNAGVAWSERRNGAYMQTPLVYGDLVYSARDNGTLSCYEARTGRRLYQERVGRGGFTASPVAADGKLYFAGETGDIAVVQAGPEFKLLATNRMGEVCMATPATAAGTLFFRTKGHVVAIAEPEKR
jgi:outer membrane protein assembly factor BamB